MKIYTNLLQHTESVINSVSADKVVYYSDIILHSDLWCETKYQKKGQKGTDLGARMQNAFETAFKNAYEKVVIVGSDLFDLKPTHIEDAFTALEKNEVVLGPSLDGGYYLLGMKKMHPNIFKNKEWGTDMVLKH